MTQHHLQVRLSGIEKKQTYMILVLSVYSNVFYSLNGKNGLEVFLIFYFPNEFSWPQQCAVNGTI